MSRSAQMTTRLERLPIEQLVEDPRNPRRHSKQQLRKLAQAICTFGFITPVVIDGTNKILAGHGRVAAAKAAGLHEVPAVRVTHLTPENPVGVLAAYRVTYGTSSARGRQQMA